MSNSAFLLGQDSSPGHTNEKEQHSKILKLQKESRYKQNDCESLMKSAAVGQVVYLPLNPNDKVMYCDVSPQCPVINHWSFVLKRKTLLNQRAKPHDCNFCGFRG